MTLSGAPGGRIERSRTALAAHRESVPVEVVEVAATALWNALEEIYPLWERAFELTHGNGEVVDFAGPQPVA